VVVGLSETDVAADAPAALPGDGLREAIIDDLRRAIGDGLVDTHLVPNDDLWIRVATGSWRAAAEALHAVGFDYFCYLSALDWMPSPYGRGEDDPTQPPPERTTEIKQGYAGGETRFQMLARLTDTTRHVGVTLKADVADDALAVDSWVPVYAGANWHERETHEMFGIGFNGHPDLRNIYLPSGFEGYPLRKDFPLLSRMVKPWPGIVDVEPLPLSDADGEAADAAAVRTGDSPLSDTGGEAADAAAARIGDSPLNDAVDPDVAPSDAVDADVAPVDAVDADVAPSNAVDPDVAPVDGSGPPNEGDSSQ
jgi:NADH-quinone oxidoreductase subunit C